MIHSLNLKVEFGPLKEKKKTKKQKVEFGAHIQ
jgi:hypothetical protein